MARVKRGVTKRRRHRRILKEAKGFFGARHRLFRVAREAVERAWVYAYRDRRRRKRDFRSLWIARINAAAREHGVSYSQLIAGLHRAGVEIDRKNLADLAASDPQAFSDLVARAKAQLA
jgi:large subunit ribosomal protein L20